MENEIKTKESRGMKESRQYRKFKDIQRHSKAMGKTVFDPKEE